MNFVTKRKWFFLGSGIVILFGIIALIVGGLNLGLDFKPGTTMTLVFSQPVEQERLRSTFAGMGYTDAVIQHSPQQAFLVSGIPDVEKAALAEQLQARFHTTVRIARFTTDGILAVIFGQPVSRADLDSRLAELEYEGAGTEQATLDMFLVRIGERSEEDEGAASTSSQALLRDTLAAEFGQLDFLNFDTISQEITSERVLNTGYAVVVASVAILLYVAWAFRKLAKSFRFGVAAILALIHDALILFAIFAIFRLEVNAFFIIAVLTVIGYGVNNTVVIFDRIRENSSRDPALGLERIVNKSITESLIRSVNTALTTLTVLLALYLFGGQTIQTFVLALVIGVVASLYSSLFIAGQLVVSWDKGEFSRLYRWIPIARRQQA